MTDLICVVVSEGFSAKEQPRPTLLRLTRPEREFKTELPLNSRRPPTDVSEVIASTFRRTGFWSTEKFPVTLFTYSNP